jgi:carotenoid cleavage dioxygenase-like enzyme
MNPSTESGSAAEAATSVVLASGGFADLRDEVGLASLPLTGRLPAWLTGSLVRVAPARWDVGERTLNHWFDGFAMLHLFQISDGNVSYANRFRDRVPQGGPRDRQIEFSEFAATRAARSSSACRRCSPPK